MSNLATVLAPLHKRLAKDCKWTWGKRQVEAFTQAKSLLSSSDLLVHYDPSKELVLSCDASPYGLGAVLSNIINGEERPISYASRTLSPAERNYAQLDKEGAAVIFGIRKLQQYLYGQKFKICTDFWVCLRFLLAYRSTPQTTTGVTPAELLFNRRLRTRLDLIRPDVRQRVETQQQSQKGQHDNTRKQRQFAEGDRVLVKNFNLGLKWKKAHTESLPDLLSYTVKYEDGLVARRHVDHLLKRHGVPNI